MVDLVKMLSHRKGDASNYRPTAGTRCLISGPNCDDENGYTYGEYCVLWSDDLFVVYRKDDCWPVIRKWEHIIAKPLAESLAAPAVANAAPAGEREVFEARASVEWNKQADQYNQWSELGADEKELAFIGYRAAIAATAPNTALVEALKAISRNETTVFDDDLGCYTSVSMSAEEMIEVARAALAAHAGQGAKA